MRTEPDPAPIELWCAFYGAIEDERLLAEYRRLLSAAERAQETRFHFADDRRRYLVTRALVRTVLSQTLSQTMAATVAPEAWQFVNGSHGRPRIANEHPALSCVSFNVSHTKGLIVLGIARGAVLGVDTENARDRQAALEIIDRYFAPAEVAELRGLPAGQQPERFFDYWTLKESYIKARGLGLSIPLDEFSFRLRGPDDLQPGEIGFSVDARQPDSADRWRFWELSVAQSYRLAVCAERVPGPTPELLVNESVPLATQRPLSYRVLRASSE